MGTARKYIFHAGIHVPTHDLGLVTKVVEVGVGECSRVCLPLSGHLPSMSHLDIIHKFIRDKYSKRFPELESLVPNALDYIRTVKVSGEESGLGRTEATRPGSLKSRNNGAQW